MALWTLHHVVTSISTCLLLCAVGGLLNAQHMRNGEGTNTVFNTLLAFAAGCGIRCFRV